MEYDRYITLDQKRPINNLIEVILTFGTNHQSDQTPYTGIKLRDALLAIQKLCIEKGVNYTKIQGNYHLLDNHEFGELERDLRKNPLESFYLFRLNEDEEEIFMQASEFGDLYQLIIIEQ